MNLSPTPGDTGHDGHHQARLASSPLTSALGLTSMLAASMATGQVCGVQT